MLSGGAAKMLSFVANVACDVYEYVEVVSIFDNETINNLSDKVIQNPIGCNESDTFWRTKCLRKIRRIIQNNGSSCVCAFLSDVAVMTRIATLGMRIVFASAERGAPFAYSKKWIVLEKWAFYWSDICFFQVEKARDFYGNNVSKKSVVIPNPFFIKENLEPNMGKRNNTIVGAGRLEDQKGFDLLINAYANVRIKHPEYTLILFGEGSQKEKLVKLTEMLKIQEYVSFPGYIDNLPKALLNEGIFVLSSRFEGIPNALIEALAVGIPSIATDCSPGGPDYLTNHGTRGILIPTNDVESMTKAIEYLIENPAKRIELAMKGPEIRKELDVNIIRNKWIDAFNDMKKMSNCRARA